MTVSRTERRQRPPAIKKQRPRRQAYSAEYKLKVVREALQRPPDSRIKPTCREYPDIEPVQLRKWIRNLAALEAASPTAKCLAINNARLSPTETVSTHYPSAPPSPPNRDRPSLPLTNFSSTISATAVKQPTAARASMPPYFCASSAMHQLQPHLAPPAAYNPAYVYYPSAYVPEHAMVDPSTIVAHSSQLNSGSGGFGQSVAYAGLPHAVAPPRASPTSPEYQDTYQQEYLAAPLLRDVDVSPSRTVTPPPATFAASRPATPPQDAIDLAARELIHMSSLR